MHSVGRVAPAGQGGGGGKAVMHAVLSCLVWCSSGVDVLVLCKDTDTAFTIKET